MTTYNQHVQNKLFQYFLSLLLKFSLTVYIKVFLSLLLETVSAFAHGIHQSDVTSYHLKVSESL